MSLLQLNEVTHSYGSREFINLKDRSKKILSNISLFLEEGTCLGLLGMSGAGKSTLGKVILGLEGRNMERFFFKGMIFITQISTVIKKFVVISRQSFRTPIHRSTLE